MQAGYGDSHIPIPAPLFGSTDDMLCIQHARASSAFLCMFGESIKHLALLLVFSASHLLPPGLFVYFHLRFLVAALPLEN
jgi:hypothetical protein